MNNPNNVVITIEVPGRELPAKYSVDPKTFALALMCIDYHCDDDLEDNTGCPSGSIDEMWKVFSKVEEFVDLRTIRKSFKSGWS
jgi:hypothetical protein